MKKLLSILGAIGLTATSTTSLISCEKPNNNENGGGNKPEPEPKPEKPQQPPENSKWEIILNPKQEVNINGDEWYFIIDKDVKINFGLYNNKELQWKFNDNMILFPKDKPLGGYITGINYVRGNNAVYKWKEKNKPISPDVDKNTGNITDWKE
ncbi:hypothetical protein SRED_001804 [Spiroplasma melliferum]|uniref:Spiroplasmavirus-related protein n=1 Tax=Spiroplasma melliferum TaxID=2134 RepID=A0ABX5UBN7_SPIME|nr:lipoprotein [Spiroplasma melliferum]QCO23337.1 hypothetical protein SRED_001804 [Spiroplasma melliferum]